MNEELKEMMDEVIKNQIEDISELKPGSEEKSKAINDLATMYRLKIEESKAELEIEEKRERRVMDNEQTKDDVSFRIHEERLKKDQLEEQIKDRYFRVGIAAAELVLPLIFYGVWMRRGFKFEKEGVYTSTTFRGLFSKFKPTK